MGIINQAWWFIKYMSVFSGPKDVFTYRRLKKFPEKCSEIVSLKLRNLNGKEVFCRPNTSDAKVMWDVFYHGYHLPPYKLKDDCVILDLGANIGLTMVDLALRYPMARVIGVELDSENVELATYNIQCTGSQCQLIHAAVWFEDGEMFYPRKRGEEWGFRLIDRDGQLHTTGQSVSALTIEAIMEKFGIKTVDFIKMDIEGAESEVLRADAKWLKHVHCLTLEVHAPATLYGCMAILREAGFDCRCSTKLHSALFAFRAA
jgi:FkbM family methyltransferase